MLSSAVSLLSLLIVTAPQAALQEASPVWSQVKSSVIYLQGRNGVSGVAALIDDTGLFLSHSSAVETQQMRAKFNDGRTFSLFVLNHDPHTQLTLLQATYWSQGERRVIKVASKTTTKNVELLAATPAGPKVGEFIAAGKVGMMKPSLRYVPLSEVQLLSSDEKIGGSMVFNKTGELVGVLGATLAASKKATTSAEDLTLALRSGGSTGGGGFGGGGTGGGSGGGSSRRGSDQYGPRMIVAYALGREVLQRVVAGFTSPSRQVQHPSIGLFFKASLNGRGVLVDSVLAGSPSSQAGLRPGDIVLDVDGVSVNSPVELAVLLFRQEIGDTIVVRYLRGIGRGSANVKVASSQSTLGL